MSAFKPIREWTIKWSGYDLTGEGTNFELILQASGYNLERNEKVKVVEAAPVLARIKELEADIEWRKESYSKLDDINIYLNDVIKERESWAEARLKTCKYLEAEKSRLEQMNEGVDWNNDLLTKENIKLKAQLSKCKEQRDKWVKHHCYDAKDRYIEKYDAEIEGTK